MLLVAAMHAGPTETAEVALRRLLREGNETIESLVGEHDPVRCESIRAASLLESTPTTLTKSFTKVRSSLNEQMMEIASNEACDGESPEQSLVRLINKRDQRINTLYEAMSLCSGR